MGLLLLFLLLVLQISVVAPTRGVRFVKIHLGARAHAFVEEAAEQFQVADIDGLLKVLERLNPL